MEGILLRSRRLLLPLLARPISLSSRLDSERPQIQRPAHPSYPRLQLLTVSAPVHTPKHADTQHLWQECPREGELAEQEKKKRANEFELLFAQELRGFLESSRTVAVFHTNHMKYYQARKAWQNARRAGLELKHYNHRIARAVLVGSRWEALMHFWDTNVMHFNQYLAFGGPDVEVKQLLALDRKIPEMMLLGSVVQGDRFLNKKQLQDLAKMPGIDVLRGELCSILQMSAQKTVSLLGSNQRVLSQNLEQYVKDQSES